MSKWKFDWRSFLLGIGAVFAVIIAWAIAVAL
jgi:hypothetical protein